MSVSAESQAKILGNCDLIKKQYGGKSLRDL